MTPTFALLAGLTIGSAVAAVTLRNLVHCGLCLALSLTGLALIFLQLGAEFIGFVQILVYVGAVAVLIVFAILLTRNSAAPKEPISNSPLWGCLIAAAVFVLLLWTGLASPRLKAPAPPLPDAPVAALGDRLLRDYVLPLQAMGLLLTAALIGAAVIALPPERSRKEPTP